MYDNVTSQATSNVNKRVAGLTYEQKMSQPTKEQAIVLDSVEKSKYSRLQCGSK